MKVSLKFQILINIDSFIDVNNDYVYIKTFFLFLQLLNVLMDISIMAQCAVKAAELFSGEPIKTQKLKSFYAIMVLM